MVPLEHIFTFSQYFIHHSHQGVLGVKRVGYKDEGEIKSNSNLKYFLKGEQVWLSFTTIPTEEESHMKVQI